MYSLQPEDLSDLRLAGQTRINRHHPTKSHLTKEISQLWKQRTIDRSLGASYSIRIRMQ